MSTLRDEILMGPATNIIEAGHSPNSYDIQQRKQFLDNDNPYEAAQMDNYSDLVQAMRKVVLYESQRKLPVTAATARTNELYNNIYPGDRGKEDWQSTARYPGMFIACERTARQYVAMMDNTPDWLKITSTTQRNQLYYTLNKEFAKFLLEEAGFRTILTQGIRDMLLNQMAHCMVTFQVNGIPVSDNRLVNDDSASIDETYTGLFEEVSPDSDIDSPAPFIPNSNIPKLRLDLIDPNWVLLDSSGNNRYRIWYSEVSIGELLNRADEYGYDKEACFRAMRQGSPEYQNMYQSSLYDAMTRGVRVTAEDEKEYKGFKLRLTHYEGDLYDMETGKNIFSKQYCVVANNIVIKAPVDLPFWDGESGIVSAPLIDVARTPYGKSLLVENNDSFGVMHNLMNMIVDFFYLQTIGAYQYDENAINPTDPFLQSRAIYPGLAVAVDGTMLQGKPAIQPIINNDVPASMWQFLQWYQGQHTENSGISPETGGGTRSRGRITAQEYQARSADAGALVQGIFNDMETKFITPIVKLSFLRALQFFPDKIWKSWVLSKMDSIIPSGASANPQMTQEWTQLLTQCAEWTAKDRFRKLGNYFSFKVEIFSSLMDRQQMIEKLSYFMGVGAKIPQFWQTANLSAFQRKCCEAFNFDPEEMLNQNPLPNSGDNPGNKSDDSEMPPVPDLSGGTIGNLQQGMARLMQGGSPLANSGAPPNAAPNPPTPIPGSGGA